jgi:hypothetical protein
MQVYLGVAVIVLVSLYILVQCNPFPQQKETFNSPESTQIPESPITVNPPFTIAPINQVDDYEHTLIFKNEGEKGLTKANRDLLMSSYPMDWSTHPPSSSVFEQGRADFVNNLDIQRQTPQTGPNPYAQLEGFEMIPPVTEKEALSTYVPKKPQNLTTYDAADAKEIIDRIYSAKGLIADMKPSTANSNVFIITGVRNKGSPVTYEPDAQVSTTPNTSAGENTIDAPVIYTSENQGLDPFFTPGDSTRDGKWDYTRFTPGLERSFAPNQPMQNWY